MVMAKVTVKVMARETAMETGMVMAKERVTELARAKELETLAHPAH